MDCVRSQEGMYAMKTRAVILAGGEGARLGILTAKRTKPAVPFAGKYRIIDFTLSNCVNSGIFDVMILAQYRPHSLIDHIGAGGPWDLNRDFTGGARIYTPYKARGASDWYLGTADAVQQNFRFIKNNNPDQVLILSGDHIYQMNYEKMIAFHQAKHADLTLASIRVTEGEASRFGIVGVNEEGQVTSFIEKPEHAPSTLANMGVYLFNLPTLDRILWEDHQITDSSHDFGKDILPRMIAEGYQIYTYPFEGYWVDVGTINSYWLAHMDLLDNPPPIDLNNRRWIIHTRTEERPPVRIERGAIILNSMISDGCILAQNAVVEQSVLSPGVQVENGAKIRASVILTDVIVRAGATIEGAIIDKRVEIMSGAHVGGIPQKTAPLISMVGKNSIVPENIRVESGAIIATDLIHSDYPGEIVRSDAYLQTKRLPYEV